MNKIVKIENDFEFPSMIADICAISLEHNLLFVQEDCIRGELLLSGRYKTTLASQLEEDFRFTIPVEINILDSIDASSASIDITNFYYDIVDNRIIHCNIEIQIVAMDILDDTRECDGDNLSDEMKEIPHAIDESLPIDGMQSSEDETVVNDIILDDPFDIKQASRDEEVVSESVQSESMNNNEDQLLFNIDTSVETYGTFVVYMMRQNETINSILEKYHTSLEVIEKYNDIKNLSIGTKIIIPILKDENI